MRAWVAGFFLWSVFGTSQAFAAGECDNPPPPVRAYLQAHPDWRLRNLADIGEDYKESSWHQYHANACPSWVQADLDGRGAVYVVMLAGRADARKSQVAVLGRDGWENLLQPSLESMPYYVEPIVTRVRPGIYQDQDEKNIGRKITLKHDAVAFVVWEKSATALYLDGRRLRKFLLSD